MSKLFKAARHMAKPNSFGNTLSRKTVRRAGKWAMQRVRPEPRRDSAGMMALKGLGAAVVALPIGYWLGRRMMDETDAAR